MKTTPNQIVREGPPQTVEQLEDRLSRPSEAAVEAMRQVDGDLLVLGAGGKMGPTLARMARRASDAAGTKRRIIGVSRFSSSQAREQLEAHGVETVACDLLDEDGLDALPDAPNVIYMAGLKFGSSGAASLTWAMNCYLPALICRKFPQSRIVAFSTGNVYRMTPPDKGGSLESDPVNPQGEYAMSCLGRERMFEHFSRAHNMPLVLLRLCYASEMRYGVLVDLARDVAQGRPIDLTTGYVNVIWQADANAMTLAALPRAASPPLVLNLAGADILRVRDVAQTFGRLLGKDAVFSGSEAADAPLVNGELGYRLCGHPSVTAEQMIGWVADWVKRDGANLGKPTHFQVRDGKF